MMKIAPYLMATLFLASNSIFAEEQQHQHQKHAAKADTRQMVEMPPKMKVMFLGNMRQHMESLDLVIASLAENDLMAAADIAEQTMGVGHGKKRQCDDKHSEHSKHAEFKQSANPEHQHKGDKEKGFGQFMPAEMKTMGMNLHNAANNFAAVARRGDMGEAYKALRQISASCVACHQSFGVQ